jgi:hypothetical protein
MTTCDRCNNFIAGKSFRGRRGDGSPATLCADCVAEIKDGSVQRKQTKEQAVSPASNMDKKGKKKKSDDKWYHHIGWGILFIVFAVLVAIQLSRLESGEVSSVRLWWPLVILYQTLGFWGAISCPSIIALLLFGWGIKELVAEESVD